MLRAYRAAALAQLGPRLRHWRFRRPASRARVERRLRPPQRCGQALRGDGRRHRSCARFMQACGVDLGRIDSTHGVELFASHEALLLDYEEPLARLDETTGSVYDLSGHLLWVEADTATRPGAHVALVDRESIGGQARPDRVAAMRSRLSSDSIPTAHAGASSLIMDRAPLAFVTCCRRSWRRFPQPERSRVGVRPDARQHDGVVDRPEDAALQRRIISEVTAFFDVHAALGTVPGGVHRNHWRRRSPDTRRRRPHRRRGSIRTVF